MTFNGASKGNLGKVGCGGVFQEFKGKVILAYMDPISHQTSYFVDVKEVHKEVEISMEKGFFSLTIEGYSKIIIEHIKGALNLSWLIGTLMDECGILLKDRSLILLYHIFHEVNHLADSLANLGIYSNHGYI